MYWYVFVSNGMFLYFCGGVSLVAP